MTTNIGKLTIDEIDNKDIVTISKLKAGETGPVITIECPKDRRMEIIGTKYTGNYTGNNAHTLRVMIADKDGNSIDLNTEIKIAHEKQKHLKMPNEIIKEIRLRYYDICLVKSTNMYTDINLTRQATFYRHKTEEEWYRFRDTIILDEGEKLVISVINPTIDIENVKLALDVIVKNKHLIDIIKRK